MRRRSLAPLSLSSHRRAAAAAARSRGVAPSPEWTCAGLCVAVRWSQQAAAPRPRRPHHVRLQQRPQRRWSRWRRRRPSRRAPGPLRPHRRHDVLRRPPQTPAGRLLPQARQEDSEGNRRKVMSLFCKHINMYV
jgi:hypothetical protein